MTAPSQTEPTPTPDRAPVPVGIRVASTLCWIVGVVTILVAVAVGIPALTSGGSLLFVAITLLAGVAVCFAAVLARRQRRLSALLVVLAWATPTVVQLASHQTPRGGSFLLFVAMLFLLANWKHLR
jgi:hypothetical protein